MDQPSQRKLEQVCKLCWGGRVKPKLSYLSQGKTSEFRRKMGLVNLFVFDAFFYCDGRPGPAFVSITQTDLWECWQNISHCGYRFSLEFQVISFTDTDFGLESSYFFNHLSYNGASRHIASPSADAKSQPIRAAPLQNKNCPVKLLTLNFKSRPAKLWIWTDLANQDSALRGRCSVGRHHAYFWSEALFSCLKVS